MSKVSHVTLRDPFWLNFLLELTAIRNRAEFDVSRFNRCPYIILNKCKKTKLIKTVIGDVVAHLKPQKFTVLSDL